MSFRNCLLAVAALLAIHAPGCQRWRVPVDIVTRQEVASPTEQPSAEKPKTPVRAEETKDTYLWYESTKSGSSLGGYRWRNDRLEEIASEPDGAVELRSFVRGGNAEKSAGAIIQLARLEPGVRDVDLERIACSISQPKTTRLAAIETLGGSPQNDAVTRLVRIGGQFRDGLPKSASIAVIPTDEDRYIAAVISELTKRKEDLTDFERCLSPRGPPLTCVALIADQEQRKVTLSATALQCFDHPSTPVRLALLRWISTVGDVNAIGEVLRITRGSQGEVFFEAVRTLGALPSANATARLDELARDSRPRVSGAATAALIHQESPAAIQSALSESRWQVKRAIAEFLVEPTSETQWDYAESLLIDPAPAVQQQLARTIAAWSATARNRAMLIGLESPQAFVRQSYWAILSEGRDDLPEFDPSASDEQRLAQLAQVREALRAPPKSDVLESRAPVVDLQTLRQLLVSYQSEDEAQRKLAELKLLGFGGELPGKLDLLGAEALRDLSPSIWTTLAAAADPRFAAAVDLKNSDVTARREAARKLASLQANAVPPLCLLIWLDRLMALEEDPLVWRPILAIATRASDAKSRAAAARLAASALKMELLDIRLTACAILEKAPRCDEHIAALEPILDSPSHHEVVAALRAIARCGELPVSTVERISALLGSGDASLRIEAALVLTKRRDDFATKMLTTAALTGPEIERRLAIERLGQTADASHIPILIGLLEASPTLRQAAVKSLEKLVGEEVVAEAEKPFMSINEQASRWKGWYARQEATAAPEPR